jgi:hypothetical protein
VDAWTPYFHAEGYSDLSGREADVYRHMETGLTQGRIFDLFLHNVRSCGHDARVIPVKGRSEIVLPLFLAGSFDVVFVDGDHTYPQAKVDIRNAQRLVCVNGILCGDDLELQIDEADEAHATANAHRDYIRDPRTGLHYHPGVALAVAECFGQVAVAKGLWSVRKGEDAWLPDAVEELSAKECQLPAHLEGGAGPRLVRSGYCGYNVVQYRDQWIAVAELLGPVDLPALSWTDFSQLEDEGFCVTGPSLAGVLAAVANSPRSLELLQIGYRGFNLVRLGPRYVALAEALGPVDLLTTPAAMLEQWITRGACVVSESLEELKARVDSWVTGQCPA